LWNEMIGADRARQAMTAAVAFDALGRS